jgi:DNA-binding LacI/PurR family transcriptional regulator
MTDSSATIRDVAAHAGCSIATVSRVCTGAGPVSDGMRKRVIEAALVLGFPLTLQSDNRRKVIGVLVPSISNPVFASALAGIEKTAQASGFATVIAQSNYDARQEELAFSALISERPTGLVMTVCNPEASVAFERAVLQSIPVVTIYNDFEHPKASTVAVDNRRAIRNLTDDLIRLGHRSIAFVSGRFESSDRARRRYEGYCGAMISAGLSPQKAVEVDFIEATQDIDLTAMAAPNGPTAIVASNDLLAFTVIAALRRMGLSVPDDVSVAGFDGIEIGRHIFPQLTTVVQPSSTMGVLAASLLLNMANNRAEPQHLRPEFTLFRGQTTGPPPVADLTGSPLFIHSTTKQGRMLS